MNLAENGIVIEKKKGMMLSRPASMLENIGTMYIKEMMTEPDADVEHSTEITLIAHYARKGEYTKAEEIIQGLLRVKE